MKEIFFIAMCTFERGKKGMEFNMRNNIFGYIFIVFIIFIMGFAFYKVKIENAEEKSNNTMSVSSTSDVKKGKEMTLSISNFDTINPIITKNKKVQDIDRLIFEPLVNITEDYKIEYCLATECAKISGNTYVIKLKSGVKWSDGQKFTSDDVKFTIDKLKENSNSVYSENVNKIQEVDIIDNYTLRIILEDDVKQFLYYLSFPILSSSYYSDVDFWNTEKNAMPTTTGRFKISEVNNNTIILTKNEKWWKKDEKIIIEKVTINLYSTVSEMYNAFKMGNIDLITTENSSYQNYVGTIGYDLSEIEGREFIFLALNTKRGLLSDLNLRKAVRASIDKGRIISNVYGNTYKPVNFLLNSSNYLVSREEENFYNTEEKNSLLQSSGWKLKDGVWQKLINYRTNIIELNLVVRESDKNRCKAAEDIKSQLEEQGIIVDIIYANDSNYNSYLNNMNYDMLLCSIDQPIAPDLTTYFGNNNLAEFEDSEVNEIMASTDNLTDENELKQKFQRLYEIYNEQVPYIGIARNKVIALKNTRLEGEIKANWYNMFYNINQWYTTE